MWRLFPSEYIFLDPNAMTFSDAFVLVVLDYGCLSDLLLLGVHSAGVVDHHLLHLMHGGLLLCPQILMVVLVRPVTSVPVHHLVEVAHDLLLLVVIGFLSLLLIHGGQILGLHLHLGYCQKISLH